MPNQAKDDVYKPAVKTNNQPQPAVVKYKVQKDDTYVSLGGQSVIAANPGVPQLSTGQVINIPNPNAPFPVTNNPLFNQPKPTLTQGSFVSGSGQVNLQGQQNRPPIGSIPSNITNGGYVSSNGAYHSTQAQSNIHTQVPIFGQVTSAQLQQQIAQQNAQMPQAPVTPARPTGVYTGNPSDPNTAAWKNYWNYSAQHPESVPQAAPIVMTRDQVWNMKAAQRRRENRGEDGSTADYQPYLQPVQPVYEPFFGNNVTQGVFRG